MNLRLKEKTPKPFEIYPQWVKAKKLVDKLTEFEYVQDGFFNNQWNTIKQQMAAAVALMPDLKGNEDLLFAEAQLHNPGDVDKLRTYSWTFGQNHLNESIGKFKAVWPAFKEKAEAIGGAEAKQKIEHYTKMLLDAENAVLVMNNGETPVLIDPHICAHCVTNKGKRSTQCTKCKGTKKFDKKPCEPCHGDGAVWITCNMCNGCALIYTI